MDEGLWWTSVMAMVSAVAATVVGVAVIDYGLGNPVGSFDVLLVPPAAVAAAFLGGTLWWALVERPYCPTDQRAASVGFLVGLLGHPLTWSLYFLAGPLFLPVDWPGAWQMFEITLAFSALSILFGGALTIVGGVVSGLIVVRCRRFVHDK